MYIMNRDVKYSPNDWLICERAVFVMCEVYVKGDWQMGMIVSFMGTQLSRGRKAEVEVHFSVSFTSPPVVYKKLISSRYFYKTVISSVFPCPK